MEEKELTVISQMTVSMFNRFVELGNDDWHPLSIAHGIDSFLFNDIFTLLPHQVLRAKDDHNQNGDNQQQSLLVLCFYL
jgi:hypothetical protein